MGSTFLKILFLLTILSCASCEKSSESENLKDRASEFVGSVRSAIDIIRPVISIASQFSGAFGYHPRLINAIYACLDLMDNLSADQLNWTLSASQNPNDLSAIHRKNPIYLGLLPPKLRTLISPLISPIRRSPCAHRRPRHRPHRRRRPRSPSPSPSVAVPVARSPSALAYRSLVVLLGAALPSLSLAVPSPHRPSPLGRPPRSCHPSARVTPPPSNRASSHSDLPTAARGRCSPLVAGRPCPPPASHLSTAAAATRRRSHPLPPQQSPPSQPPADTPAVAAAAPVAEKMSRRGGISDQHEHSDETQDTYQRSVIQGAWISIARTEYRDFVATAKSYILKGKRPTYIFEQVGATWRGYWGTPAVQAKSAQASKNRLSEPTGPGTGIVIYHEGSCSALDHTKMLTREKNIPIENAIYETFMRMHYKDGKFFDRHSQARGEEVMRQVTELRQQGGEVTSRVVDHLFREMVTHDLNGHMLGMVMMSQMISSIGTSQQSTSTSQCPYAAFAVEVVDLRSELEVRRQREAEMAAQIAAQGRMLTDLQAQIATMMQMYRSTTGFTPDMSGFTTPSP